ncbi:4Fe-4S binding protein [bacterium]|nr:4Fe-4S binding protein [bacterium]
MKARLVLRFPPLLVDQPVVYKLIKDYNLVFNILRADITPDSEGLMVLEIEGEERNFQKGLRYLEEKGVKVQPLSQDIVMREELCTHCGACVVHCPTGALHFDEERRVIFSPEKCVACEVCVDICPFRAMEITLG